ncbi:HD-GYP domain-containing protein [Alteromonas sediminis]|uniref:HD-GYP domain-containing protein n=1 Tax=Alteromonas sediminis TaxID=2259342 RepID=A0A3N5Y337_9ALTE|nr:HD-GYP domain-containing protein [Alteromonas sediminis]RPJ68262.1 HD-GYP domain-containing protein [Alteromonas sediminis]
MLKILSVDELVPGHYVNRVVAQQGNVVMRSKGQVKTAVGIEKIKQQGITKVEVDLSKSRIEAPAEKEQVAEPELSCKPQNTEASGEDLHKANDLYLEAVMIQGEFLSKLKSGAANDITPIQNISQSIIESVFDNPSAMCCLTMIKNADQYLLEHGINCSVLIALFADHLGYDSVIIEELSLGVMSMDLGMTWVSPEIRNNNVSLTQDDWVMIKNHVEHGLDLLERCGDMPTISRTVVEQHHERVDGSGYPKGLSGDDVSPFARMAAIVDSYDAMISERPYQKALPPAVALKRLSKTPGLDSELVKQFIACIGIYPVGSLVKLKSGRLGLVAKPNPDDMLKPVVMTFYSVVGNHHSDIKRIDLSKIDDEIEASVQPADFNINLPRFFRDVFVHQV